MEEVHVFVKFLELVQKHSDTEHGIEFYAGKLDVEPKELSRIIWEKSDSSFSDWIKTKERKQLE